MIGKSVQPRRAAEDIAPVDCTGRRGSQHDEGRGRGAAASSGPPSRPRDDDAGARRYPPRARRICGSRRRPRDSSHARPAVVIAVSRWPATGQRDDPGQAHLQALPRDGSGRPSPRRCGATREPEPTPATRRWCQTEPLERREDPLVVSRCVIRQDRGRPTRNRPDPLVETRSPVALGAGPVPQTRCRRGSTHDPLERRGLRRTSDRFAADARSAPPARRTSSEGAGTSSSSDTDSNVTADGSDWRRLMSSRSSTSRTQSSNESSASRRASRLCRTPSTSPRARPATAALGGGQRRTKGTCG